jgi:hypothetical protein
VATGSATTCQQPAITDNHRFKKFCIIFLVDPNRLFFWIDALQRNPHCEPLVKVICVKKTKYYDCGTSHLACHGCLFLGLPAGPIMARDNIFE